MFPVSGPGSPVPFQSRGPLSSQRKTVVEPAAVESPAAEPSLIHPGTALEFRRPLEEILRALPLPLLRSIARQGYCIHVIDSTGFHPLTLEVRAVDPLAIWRDGGPVVAVALERAFGLLELAGEYGAVAQEELLEWCELLGALNPHVQSEPLEAGLWLALPDLGYWYGRRMGLEEALFLHHPHTLVGEKPGSVAAMVTHGEPLEGNLILFWDQTFRGVDGLMDWYVLHELGHTVDYSFAFLAPDRWREWIAEWERLPHVTRYGEGNRHENFAETFAAWARVAGTAVGGGEGLVGQRRACDRSVLDARAVELVEFAVGWVMGA